MNIKESLDNSWSQDIPKTNYILPYKTPKQLLKVIDILKQIGISTLKISYEFKSQFDRNTFKEVLKLQQNDEHYRQRGQNIEQSYKKSLQRKTKNGYTFFIGNMLKSEAFLKAYRGNKLDQLQSNSKVKVHLYNRDLYIESDNPVTKGSILYSQMMHMYKRLSVYIFYKNPILWEIVNNSEQFKKQLKDKKIHCFAKPGKWKHVICYSQDLKEEQIRKEVLKLNSFQRRILMLNDSQLSQYDNLRIFDVVFRSIRSTIQKIKKVYETDIQVNKKNSSFILNLKHEAFAKQPIEDISKVVSDLFILSFYLRNPRSFINQVKRNSKSYPFIQVSHYNKTAFCCINRKLIKNKKEVLEVFKPFLQQLEQKSKLTIHMKANCVLQEQSTIPDQILDLTDQFNLQVQDYQNIKDSKSFNIVVKPKLFNKPEKKNKKKLQFSNFILKLLMIEEVTDEQLNQAIFEHQINELSTENSSKSSRRGNRQNKNEEQSNSEEPHNKRGNRDRLKDRKPQQIVQAQSMGRGRKIEKQQLIKNQERARQVTQERVQQQNSWLNESKQIQEQVDPQPSKVQKQVLFQYDFQFPEQCTSSLYKKDKRDGLIQDIISKNLKIEVKAWKLKLNYDQFDVEKVKKADLNMKQGVFVREIQNSQNHNKVSELEIIDIKELKDKSTFFLVHKSSSPSLWIATHELVKY